MIRMRYVIYIIWTHRWTGLFFIWIRIELISRQIITKTYIARFLFGPFWYILNVYYYTRASLLYFTWQAIIFRFPSNGLLVTCFCCLVIVFLRMLRYSLYLYMHATMLILIIRKLVETHLQQYLNHFYDSQNISTYW